MLWCDVAHLPANSCRGSSHFQPAGMTLGLISDRGRETIMHFAGALRSRGRNTAFTWLPSGLLATCRLLCCPPDHLPSLLAPLICPGTCLPLLPPLLPPPSVSITYSVVALGLMSTVGALPTFGRDRVVFFRESASGEGGKRAAALRYHAAGHPAPLLALLAVVRAGRTSCFSNLMASQDILKSHPLRTRPRPQPPGPLPGPGHL